MSINEFSHRVKASLFQFLLVQFYHVNSSNVDPDHRALVPECGQSEPMKARISNAEQSQHHYPWIISVILLDYRHSPATNKPPFLCGGSIITET